MSAQGLDSLLARAGLLLFRLDRRGLLSSIQGPVERLFGFSRDEFLELEAATLFGPVALARVRDELRRKFRGEAQFSVYEVGLIAKDGRSVPVKITSVPVVEGDEVIAIEGLIQPLEPTLAAASAATRLTRRQQEVLRLLAEGLRPKQIARRLGMSEPTARNHVRAIFRTLDAHSQLEAVVKAIKLHLVALDG